MSVRNKIKFEAQKVCDHTKTKHVLLLFMGRDRDQFLVGGPDSTTDPVCLSVFCLSVCPDKKTWKI